MKLKYFILSLLSAAILVWLAVLTYPQDKLQVIFCDVGQGDAILITYGSTQVLVDGGPGDKVLACLSNNLPFWDRKLEMVILTHPDSDHLGGLVPVIERYSIDLFVSHSLLVDKAFFWEAREKISSKKVPVYSPKAGDKLKVGKLVFEVFWPEEKQGSELVWQTADDPQVLGIEAFTSDLNELSIVTKLSYQDFDILLAGDIGFEQERKIEDLIGQVEVLKVAHHGSKYSTLESFLEKIQPELAVICVGRNSFGHPTQEVLERLKNQGIKIKRTDLDGEIKIVKKGKNWYLSPN